MRHVPALVFCFCACAAAAGAQATAAPQSPAAQIAAAEAEGAKHPRVPPATATATPARTCTTIRPEQIVLPTTRAGSPYVQSGDFEAVSISFGWDQTYEQAKMPLRPLHPEAIGAGLRIRLIRLDEPGYGTPFELPGFNARTLDSSYEFFASWPKFPTPGKWMMIVTAGANWGCFVLDRPVK
jgi:hypothetical protein